ncbi:MAG: hypothetical protein K0S27_951 [Gammaproteobacteria bacterium]|jgi:hypothetical protein|nr:hypothetical protein [Gammaproteobacteria bacterium]
MLYNLSNLKRRETNEYLPFNSYRQATVISFILSLALEIGFLISGDMEDFPTAIAFLGFNGHLLSSSTYIGRTVDLSWPQNRQLNEEKGQWREFILTACGIVFGIFTGITLCIIKHTALTCIGITDAMIFTMRAVSSFAGIGNRLGNLPERRGLEKKAIGLASVIGLTVGIFLFLTHSIPLICVAGINMFFQGNSALPTLISFLIAVGYITSTYQSAADYASKSWRFFKAIESETLHDPTNEDNKQIKERFLEYFGSFLLGTIGLTISLYFIPHFVVGAASLAATPTIIMSCISILGGLGCRLGRLGDRYYKFEYDEQHLAGAFKENTTDYSLLAMPRPTSREIKKVASASKPKPPIPPLCNSLSGCLMGFFYNRSSSSRTEKSVTYSPFSLRPQ